MCDVNGELIEKTFRGLELNVKKALILGASSEIGLEGKKISVKRMGCSRSL